MNQLRYTAPQFTVHPIEILSAQAAVQTLDHNRLRDREVGLNSVDRCTSYWSEHSSKLHTRHKIDHHTNDSIKSTSTHLSSLILVMIVDRELLVDMQKRSSIILQVHRYKVT